MALEITEFGDHPSSEQDCESDGAVSMSIGEEVELNGVEKGKEDPIVNGVYKHSFEGHGDPAEYMYKSSLILSLEIMQNGHDQRNQLNLIVLVLVAKEVEDREDDDGPCILNIEHIVPLDLWT